MKKEIVDKIFKRFEQGVLEKKKPACKKEIKKNKPA